MTEGLTLSKETLYLFTTIGVLLLTWLIFLTKQMYSNQEKIAINTANDKKVSEELDKIYAKVDQTKNELQGSFDKLERKIDLFMINEITLLKQMITPK